MAILTAYSNSLNWSNFANNSSAYHLKFIDAQHIQGLHNDGQIVIDMYLTVNRILTSVSVSKEGHQIFDIKELSLDLSAISNPDSLSDAYVFSSNDTFNGSPEYDVLSGYAGNDNLYGNNGNDILNGGTENDTLTGGLGRDALSGGTGADIFDFNYLSESLPVLSGRDTINDFNHAQADKLNLHDIDANLQLSGNQDFRFIGAAKFTAAGQIRFDAATHILYASNDADTQAEFSLQLTGVSRLQGSDIIL